MADCGCSPEFKTYIEEAALPEHIDTVKGICADECKADEGVVVDDDYKEAVSDKFEDYIKPSHWANFKASLHRELDLLNDAGLPADER